MIQLTLWINMSHFNLISLAVKLEVLNIDWGLVFIIYSKYPRTRLIWLIKSIIAPRGGLSTPGISICSTQNWGAGHFISDPKHCNDGPLRGLSARIGSWPNNLSLPASGEYFPLPPQTRCLETQPVTGSGQAWLGLHCPASVSSLCGIFTKTRKLAKEKSG